jgi:putative ABC transport system permease protein
MTWRDNITTALKGVSANRSRSLLTILGIVIGITAIMVMMSIGKGAENLILNEIGGLGAETIVIRPGREPMGPSDIGSTLFSDSLKNRDLDFLRRKENVPELIDIMPALVVPGPVSFEGETFGPDILGGSAEFFSKAFNVFTSEGVLFDENDIKANASVAVIGPEVKKELFGESNAVGENIKIKNRRFRVVGVLAEKGQVSFLNFDRIVIIPYSTAQLYLLGIDYFHEIILKTTSPDVVDRTVHDIEITMREAHGITDPEKDDFFVVTQQGIVEQIRVILGALTAFLSSVVAIALVVGGIGIMNIMLVSVTERTKEIGLRKAIGATNKNIMTQFLLEAIILTLVGGIIGIILGAILSLSAGIIISQVLSVEWEFVFPISAVLLGLGVASVVGLIFGLYPARKASQKDPIEALRYE